MNRKGTYEIDLTALKEGVNEFDYHVDNDFFESAQSGGLLGADVDVHAEVTKRHDSYKLLLEFDGELLAPCDRCLEAVPVEVATDYEVTVRHGEDFDSSVTSDGAELMVIPENATRLDLAPIIHDTLLLAVPLRCVHPEGECDEEMAEKIRQHMHETTEDEPQD